MCQKSFESSSVSGVITMKRILDARERWGMNHEGKKHKAATYLYRRARLCVFCSQFFCTDGGL
ncbi:unnamed protein product, partial [Choristocarpus tenellus]